MNYPAITIRRASVVHRIASALRGGGASHLREAIENTVAPRPSFGLPGGTVPPDRGEPCYELRGTCITLALLVELLGRLPFEITQGCQLHFNRDRELRRIALTASALRCLYREISLRQCNAVRALLSPGAAVYWPDFARHERARRLLAAALGLSVPADAELE
jgi:hypothetical protein